SNLKRALDRGGAYADELGAVSAVARDSIDVSALEPFKDKGVPTVSTLLSNLQELSFTIIQAADQSKDGSWVDKLVSGAKSIVQVRRTGTTADVDPSSTEGIVARVEQELRSGRVAAALKTAQALPGPAKAVAKDWLTQLEARGAVDAAIAKIETTLQDALTSQPAPAKKG
ncbi:MAG: mitofilin family membrane protein, partial [Pseudomonadota bacterium]